MRTSFKQLTAVSLAAFALIAAGCGDDDDDDQAATPPPAPAPAPPQAPVPPPGPLPAPEEQAMEEAAPSMEEATGGDQIDLTNQEQADAFADGLTQGLEGQGFSDLTISCTGNSPTEVSCDISGTNPDGQQVQETLVFTVDGETGEVTNVVAG